MVKLRMDDRGRERLAGHGSELNLLAAATGSD